jgi:hypothetical protein
VPNPTLNETTAPYQFDGTISTGGANVSLAMSPLSPGDLGLKAWNFPTYQCTGTATFSVVGSVYLSMMHLQYGLTYSNVYVNVLANVGTATAGSCFAGLYNSAGTLVATTADLSGVLGTHAGSTGILTFPLATAYTPASSGQFYAGMFFNASGTASFPVLAGIQGQTAANSLTTWAGSIGFTSLSTLTTPYGTGGTLQPSPWAAVATTSGTAMPATFALGSAGTTGAQVFWCGLA